MSADCKVKGCQADAVVDGLCKTHWFVWRKQALSSVESAELSPFERATGFAEPERELVFDDDKGDCDDDE